MSYSTEELFQCIFDCMTESLPESWESASLQATIQGADVKSNFRYVDESTGREMEFTPQNFVAPLNAVMELQKMATEEGRPWKRIDLHVTRDGELKYSVC